MFRVYATTQLGALLSAFGGSMRATYAECVERLGRPQDTRTGDEVAADVISRLGLEVMCDEPARPDGQDRG